MLFYVALEWKWSHLMILNMLAKQSSVRSSNSQMYQSLLLLWSFLDETVLITSDMMEENHVKVVGLMDDFGPWFHQAPADVIWSSVVSWGGKAQEQSGEKARSSCPQHRDRPLNASSPKQRKLSLKHENTDGGGSSKCPAFIIRSQLQTPHKHLNLACSRAPSGFSRAFPSRPPGRALML